MTSSSSIPGVGTRESELERLSAAASPGMALAFMDDYRLRVGPDGSNYIGEFKTIAITSTCEKAGANLVFLATLWNAYRSGELIAAAAPVSLSGGEEKEQGATQDGSGSQASPEAPTDPRPTGVDPSRMEPSDEVRAYLREVELAALCPGDPRLTEALLGPAGPAIGLDGYGSQARPLAQGVVPRDAERFATLSADGRPVMPEGYAAGLDNPLIRRIPQGIEAEGQAPKGLGASHESPVAESDAPEPLPLLSEQKHREGRE